MARFDVYANPGSHAATTPYLLDVQSNLLDGLDTRMVIPLRSLDHFPKVKLPTRLTPILSVADGFNHSGSGSDNRSAGFFDPGFLNDWPIRFEPSETRRWRDGISISDMTKNVTC